jgi:hypothetical protein
MANSVHQQDVLGVDDTSPIDDPLDPSRMRLDVRDVLR